MHQLDGARLTAVQHRVGQAGELSLDGRQVAALAGRIAQLREPLIERGIDPGDRDAQPRDGLPEHLLGLAAAPGRVVELVGEHLGSGFPVCLHSNRYLSRDL